MRDTASSSTPGRSSARETDSRRAAGGGDRGEIRRGGKGGGWNGFRAGRVAIRVERFGAARDGAPPAVISDHDEDRKLHYLRNMVADRRVGEQVRPVADGGNNQLFPARKLQPQRDGQGFAQPPASASW